MAEINTTPFFNRPDDEEDETEALSGPGRALFKPRRGDRGATGTVTPFFDAPLTEAPTASRDTLEAAGINVTPFFGRPEDEDISGDGGTLLEQLRIERASRKERKKIARFENAAERTGIDIEGPLTSEKRGVGAIIGQAGLTALGAVLDFVSRPNFAIAGAVEEFARDDDENALLDTGDAIRRMGRELFSGIGSIHGDKKAFGEVFEDTGLIKTELGHLSNAMPFLFSDTGEEWLKFEKGGFFDFTGRGAVGFGADVVLDPLTYLTFGGASAGRIAITKGVGEVTEAVAERTLREVTEVAAGKAGRRITQKGLSKKGSEELAEEARKALGVSKKGVETLRRDLYSMLPNKGGKLDFENAARSVQDAVVETVSPLADDITKAERKRILAEWSGRTIDELLGDPVQGGSAVVRNATQTARLAAEQQLSHRYLSDPDTYKYLFEDGGLKFFGKSIPLTTEATRRLSEMSAEALMKIRRYRRSLEGKSNITDSLLRLADGVSGVANAVAKSFRRDRVKDPVYLALKQQLIDSDGMRRAKYGTAADNLIGNVHLTPTQWEKAVAIVERRMRDFHLDQARVGRNLVDEELDDPSSLARFESAFGAGAAAGGQLPVTYHQPFTDIFQQLRTTPTLNLSDKKAGSIARALMIVPRHLDLLEFQSMRRELGVLGVSKKMWGLGEQRARKVVSSFPEGKLLDELKDPDKLAKQIIKAKEFKQLKPDAKTALKTYLGHYITRNYVSNIPMFFDNRSANITQGIRHMNRVRGIPFKEDILIGRHRGFYSIMNRSAARKAGEEARRANPGQFPQMRMVSDVREILRRRLDQHAEDLHYRDWTMMLRQQFQDDTDIAVMEIFRDLLTAVPVMTKGKLGRVGRKIPEDIWDQGMKAVREFEIKRLDIKRKHAQWVNNPDSKVVQLSIARKARLEKWAKEDPVKARLWVTNELLNVKTRRNLSEFFERYEKILLHPNAEKIFPPVRDLATARDADFNAFRELTIKGGLVTDNIYVPAGIWDDFSGAQADLIRDKNVNRVLRIYDNFNRFFKTYVTAPFPQFHFRNAYSNVAQAFLDVGMAAFNPKDHSMALAITAKGMLRDSRLKLNRKAREQLQEGLSEWTFKTRDGRIFSIDDVERDAKRYGVWTDDAQIFELETSYAPATGGRIQKGREKFEAGLRKTGTAIENEARLQLFIRHLKRGLSPEEAAEKVKKVLFDYQSLSGFERGFMRRVIPFYTWWRKNLTLQLESLFTKPGRIAVQADLLRQREEEVNRLALYDQEGTAVRLGGDGKTLTILSGVDLPISQLRYFDVLGGNTRRGRELLSMANPLLRVIPETTLGISTFTGKDLTRSEQNTVGKVFENAPKGVKDWIGWKKDTDRMTGKVQYSMNGRLAYVFFDFWAISRVVRTSDKLFSEMMDESPTQTLLWFLTATKVERFEGTDWSKQDLAKLRQRRRALEEALEKRGVMRPLELSIPDVETRNPDPRFRRKVGAEFE